MNNGLNLMQARLDVYRGENQQNKMIKDKRKTFDRVVLYSYQGAEVRKLDSEEKNLALINPNQVKQNYDDKIISIGYECEYEPGTVFEWVNTGTKWLIYLQDLTELAYFKGDIRKCSYEISWKDENGEEKKTYAAIRGPVETKIDSAQKEGISLDTPNHTLNILLPKNKDTLKQFKRYSEFYLKPLADGDTPICWRVEATDTISMPGILELTAIEYYSNEFEDDIQNGIVGGLIEKISEPENNDIEGNIFIKPKTIQEYKYTGDKEFICWNYDTRLPIEVINDKKSNPMKLKWKTTYTGQFVLQCLVKDEEKPLEKTIVVESLF